MILAWFDCMIVCVFSHVVHLGYHVASPQSCITRSQFPCILFHFRRIDLAFACGFHEVVAACVCCSLCFCLSRYPPWVHCGSPLVHILTGTDLDRLLMSFIFGGHILYSLPVWHCLVFGLVRLSCVNISMCYGLDCLLACSCCWACAPFNHSWRSSQCSARFHYFFMWAC